MINKEFASLVIIATITAWPISYYYTEKWLQNFEYHIDFPFELYPFSGFAALLIVLITISIRTYKAAKTNPVNAIRY